MRYFTYTAITIIVALCIVGCGAKTQSDSNMDSTPYCEDSAMAHFISEPKRAMTLLDSAVIVGTLTAQRAEYLKAIVAYNGMDNSDTCLAICQKLIDKKAWTALPDSDDAVSFQVDVYRLMTTAATTTGNQLAVIRYATEGVRLAHGVKNLEGDEADLMSRMGYVMCQTGQTAEGLDNMRRAENIALNSRTWSSLLAYFNNVKKMYHVLSDEARYEEARNKLMLALEKMDGVKKDPAAVQDIPEAMLTDKEALEEFAAFYNTRFYAFLATIDANQGRMDEAKTWVDKYYASAKVMDAETMAPIIHPLIMLGRFEEARKYLDEVKRSDNMDSISEPRLSLIREEMLLAERLGDKDATITLSHQMDSVTNILNKRSYHIMLADATAQYKLQDERIRREDSEQRLWLMTIVSVFLLSAIVLFVAIAYIRRLTKRGKELNTELTKVKTEVKKLSEEKKTTVIERKPLSEAEVYKRAVYVMDHFHPYKDPEFDINTLSQMVFSNRTYVSMAINKMTNMNFRSWLAKYRIEFAIKSLQENPEIKIDTLLKDCGYDNRTNFYRQFKSVTGMTPTEYLAKTDNNKE